MRVRIIEQNGKSFKGVSKTKKKKKHIKRLSFVTQFKIEFSLPFIGCRKVLGKMSVVPIKVVPVKNDYFLHPKFELHRYQQMNEKNTAHISVMSSLFR